MTTIKQVLDLKGHDVYTIDADQSVFEAISEMARKDIGALVVLEGGEFIGIFTERHYARNVVLKGKSSPTTPVREVMTRHVLCARADETVEECMALMTDKAERHLPVLENGRLVGIVSIGDLVKSIISTQKFMIEQLELYISG